MKKSVILFTLMLIAVVRASAADTYTSLWQRFEKADAVWQPRTAIAVLDKIIMRATAEKAYGHLVKAQIARGGLTIRISPDSLDAVAAQMAAEEQRAKSPVLRAVYATALGKLYAMQQRGINRKAYQQKSRDCFARALKDPDLLAKTPAKTYEPAVERRDMSKAFGGDLLHVVAGEAKEYGLLNRYYEAHGNRRAACLAACLDLRENHSDWLYTRSGKQHYQHAIDSLINVYQDLDECGELAIDHYEAMDEDAKDIVERRIRYIDWAIAKWGAWPRMNILRNKRTDLTAPQFNISLQERQMLPGKERKIHINSIRNIRQLSLNVYRLSKPYADISSETLQQTDKLVETLRQDAGKTPVQTVVRKYIGHADYKLLSDSATLAPLPLGSYLVEVQADVKGVKPQYALLSVSDLLLMVQSQSAKGTANMRLVVVNATTGNPVPEASVIIRRDMRRCDQDTVIRVNRKGEALCTGKWGDSYMRATSGMDINSPFGQTWSMLSYLKSKAEERFSFFTDRSIYRPGQTVQVAVVGAYRSSATQGDAITGRDLTLRLHDANSRVIAEHKVTTDSYGTAHSQFVLPATGLTGRYYIDSDMPYSLSTSFRVEEYKRPTFKIEWDTIRTRYEAGDTLLLTGRVMTYAGVPVQHAKVSAKSTRRIGLWWWRFGRGDSHVEQLPATVTDSQGRFGLRLPLTVKDADYDRQVFYSFDVSATVTDAAGESHDAQTSVALGMRPTVLSCDMADQIERDSIGSIRFDYRNSAGQNIDGTVNYTLGKHSYTAKANEAVDLRAILKGLKSGRHVLTAVCDSDTLVHPFVLFSATDSRAPIDTPDWFYLSGTRFKGKDKVRLQLGSSAPEQYVVYTLFADDRVIESGSLHLKGQLHLRDFTYRDDYGDALTLTYAWVKDGRRYIHTQRIMRPMPDKRLVARWTTFRDRLVPGLQETWTLHVIRPDGKPADAQLIASLYDHSLDAIYAHDWRFYNEYGASRLYNADWRIPYSRSIGLYSYLETKMLAEPDLSLSQLTEWPCRILYRIAGPMYASSAPVDRKLFVRGVASAESTRANMVKDELASDAATPEPSATETETEPEWASLRENFNETAFFYPSLQTDAKGDIAISFRLPESVTTWKFKGLVHDRNLNATTIEALAVAQKKVMVQPNMPRFVRNGDHATIAVRVTNASDQRQSGRLRLELTTADGSRTLVARQQNFDVDANAAATLCFAFDLSTDETLVVCKAMATGSDFADGEQHYLPVLPDREQVVNTRPFTLSGTGTHTIDLTSLYSAGATRTHTTIEYTDNPAWLMIQALPSMANPSGDNAMSLVTAYYANAIAQHIIGSSPAIAQAINLWQQRPDESLTGVLEKNESLKQTVLAETPWLMDAARDTQRMRSLARYLDANQLAASQSSILRRLGDLQDEDGTLAWWKGMTGNVYMTAAVAETLARLDRIVGKQTATQNILDNALTALDRVMTQRVEEMKKRDPKNHTTDRLDYIETRYLYASALAGRKATPTIDYLLDIMEKQKHVATIADKAQSAVVLALYGRDLKAKECLKSAREFTVYKDGMGRYYDTPLAGYSWCSYRIPTQVATIEAMGLLAPQDSVCIDEMRQWLLQEKRTTAWDTPINSVNAIYAFLKDNGSALAPATGTRITIDGKPMEADTSVPMIGAQTWQADGAVNSIAITKQQPHTSWGAVYASMMLPSDKIEKAGEGFSIERQVVGGTHLGVGDKVTVRIIIRADRDYDFVEVTDKRAACLEPVVQLSGYRQGCYEAPRDCRTSYYFDRMSKGTHVIETSYYVDRAGDYRAGQCTVQCAYSPSFAGRVAGETIHVNP